MGQVRRHVAEIERREDARAARFSVRGLAPATLSDAELDRTRLPTTRPPAPVRVLAWVRYGEHAVRVVGLAVAWTPTAVAVRWSMLDVEGDKIEREDRAWLWQGAVEWIEQPSPVDVRLAINRRRNGADESP